MNNQKAFNRDLEKMAWGLLFTWWGFTELTSFLPKGGGWVGFGLILLGLNVARSFEGIRLNAFSMSLGLLAIVAGSRELARSTASQPLILCGLAIVLVGCGAFMLTLGFRRN